MFVVQSLMHTFVYYIHYMVGSAAAAMDFDHTNCCVELIVSHEINK